MRRLAVLLLAVLPLASCSKKIAGEQELFDQARQFESTGEYNKALDSYQTVVDHYTRSPDRYKAMFMIGYIQLDYLKDNKKAASAFDRMLKQYPECDLADDARVLRDAAVKGRDVMSIFQDSLSAK